MPEQSFGSYEMSKKIGNKKTTPYDRGKIIDGPKEESEQMSSRCFLVIAQNNCEINLVKS